MAQRVLKQGKTLLICLFLFPLQNEQKEVPPLSETNFQLSFSFSFAAGKHCCFHCETLGSVAQYVLLACMSSAVAALEGASF
jgi:hypothetical protein